MLLLASGLGSLRTRSLRVGRVMTGLVIFSLIYRARQEVVQRGRPTSRPTTDEQLDVKF